MPETPNCAACGHERRFHRSIGYEPEACSIATSPGPAHGPERCGCRAAFEVDAERNCISTLAGRIAGWTAGAPASRGVEIRHRPDQAGPNWVVLAWEHEQVATPPGDVTRVSESQGTGFTLAEALLAALDGCDA